MRDDPASLVLSSSTDANFIQQHQCRPGRACHGTPRDAYDAEVGHGRKVLDCSPPDNNSDRKKRKETIHQSRVKPFGGRRGIKKKIGIEKRLTCQRRADFSPANISKMQQHALLQRIKNVLARYLLWGLRPSGEIMAVTRCRVGRRRRRWMGNEFDEEPAVLVRVSYSFVSMTAEGQDSRKEEDKYFESNHTYGWRGCLEC